MCVDCPIHGSQVKEMDDITKELDTELIAAIDSYLSNIRYRLVKRVERGEREYHGLWKTKPLAELIVDIEEEEDDGHVYRAMMQWRATVGHF
jgi:hypothetical protein